MAKGFLKLGDVKIAKRKFHYFENAIAIDVVDSNKILISEGFLYGLSLFRRLQK